MPCNPRPAPGCLASSAVESLTVAAASARPHSLGCAQVFEGFFARCHPHISSFGTGAMAEFSGFLAKCQAQPARG